jgi:hypothetical protein
LLRLKRMTKLVADWLPPPRILHPWPDERFDVRIMSSAGYGASSALSCGTSAGLFAEPRAGHALGFRTAGMRATSL